eukprot:COSAG06_NODE_54741_length_293_cov_0.706186_1_plen_71_part_10
MIVASEAFLVQQETSLGSNLIDQNRKAQKKAFGFPQSGAHAPRLWVGVVAPEPRRYRSKLRHRHPLFAPLC